MIDLTEEQLVKKGKMTKSPFTMTAAEEKQWEEKKQAEAKAYLFSIGQPFVYGEAGHTIALYADGSKKVLR